MGKIKIEYAVRSIARGKNVDWKRCDFYYIYILDFYLVFLHVWGVMACVVLNA